jgi:hypothetical protein
MRTKFVTREDYITKEDREVWERYRATWQADAQAAVARDEGIDGADANLIAAFLDDRLSEAERSAFEGRLVEDPMLLDALIAAKSGLHSGPTQAYAVPESVRVWAANTFTAEVSSRRQPVAATSSHAKPRRGFRPIFAAIAVSLVLIVAAGVGTILLTHDQPGIVAQADHNAGAKHRGAEKWDPRTNSIFANPENAYFDGLKVE